MNIYVPTIHHIDILLSYDEAGELLYTPLIQWTTVYLAEMQKKKKS